MEPTISIPENVLAQFMASHSRLSQAEYSRNRLYNDSHYSFQAEEALLDALVDSLGHEQFVRLLSHVFAIIDDAEKDET